MKLLLLLIPYLLTTTIQVNSQKKLPEKEISKEDINPPDDSSIKTINAALSSDMKSIMVIDISKRSSDLITVFNNLKKEFSYTQISIKLSDGSILKNITEITASEEGTMLIVKMNSNQGMKHIAIFTEDVKGYTSF